VDEGVVELAAGDDGAEGAGGDGEVEDFALAEVAAAGGEAGFVVLPGLQVAAPGLAPEGVAEFAAFLRGGEGEEGFTAGAAFGQLALDALLAFLFFFAVPRHGGDVTAAVCRCQ